jgi:hypothetical protein
MNKDLFSKTKNSNTDYFNLKSSKEKRDFTNKKRSRKKTIKNYSKKEEERILKYALKLSEKEQKLKESQIDIKFIEKYSELDECKIFYPNEEDFKNPIGYFDSLWNGNNNNNNESYIDIDTGIIKIVPPESWKKFQKEYFLNKISERAFLNSKKISTRKQKLGQLYKAKVFNI